MLCDEVDRFVLHEYETKHPQESKAQELKSEIDNRLERFEELARKHSISMMRVMQYKFFVVVVLLGRRARADECHHACIWLYTNCIDLSCFSFTFNFFSEAVVLHSVLGSRMLLICMFLTKKN